MKIYYLHFIGDFKVEAKRLKVARKVLFEGLIINIYIIYKYFNGKMGDFVISVLQIMVIFDF
jgi:hypothetical protein